MKKIYLFFILSVTYFTGHSQLNLGDIAFTGYNADGNDGFSFVTFVDIPANTEIGFTDNGWLSGAGGFRSGEGNAIWTSPATVVTAGTEIYVSDVTANIVSIGTFTKSGSFAFVATGDEIFAFNQSNIPIDNTNQDGFISAIQLGPWDDTNGATSTTTSALPSILIGYNLTIDPESDNVQYNCSTASGTISDIRTALQDASNWNTHNTTPFDLSIQCGFTISTLSINAFNSVSFNVYPNPTNSNFINITSTDNDIIKVIAFDVLGKKVLENKNVVKRLNISNLRAGVYILQLTQNNASVTKKLVIR